MKSIAEVAKELNVSSKTVNRWVKRLGVQGEKKGRFVYLSEEDIEQIKEGMEDKTKDTKQDTGQTDKGHVQGSVPNSVLVQQLQFLQEQLKAKDELLIQQAKHLDQQQQLSLKDKQQIEQLSFRIEEINAQRKLLAPEKGILPSQEWLEGFVVECEKSQEEIQKRFN